MREFFVNNGPHIRDKNSTSKMMRNLLIALVPIIIFACYKNGFGPYFKGYGNLFDAFKPLLMIIIAILVSWGCEVVSSIIILRKKNDDLKEYLKYSYGIFPGLFLALTLPINTPIWILILGVVVSSIIGKMIFGGFGNNIFNPALVGNLFVTSFFYSNIAEKGSYLNKLEIDTISGATPLSNLKQLNYTGTYNQVVNSFNDIWHFFTGFIPGSLGETSKVLCLLALLYLIFTKVIKWRIPVIYITTVFIMTAIIGYANNLSIWYPLFHILSGGLIFGAVFMATDPVTSPTTSYGQILFAFCLGILTVVFRFLSIYPEGVLISILIMNMVVFILDRIGSKVRFDYKKSIIPTIIVLILLILSTLYICNNIGSKNKQKIDKTFNVINKIKNNNVTVYTVSQKGFHGVIKAEVFIDSDGKVVNINVLSQNESVWSQIIDNNYLTKLIDNQKDLTKLDTISGATYTSNYLKQLVTKTLNDYNGIKTPANSNTDTNSSTTNNPTDANSSATSNPPTDTNSSVTKKNNTADNESDGDEEDESEEEEDD